MPARPLARAHERPAQRLGRGEAALVGRERRRRARAVAWSKTSARPRRASGVAATQSRGPPPGRGRRRELDDRAAQRPVADLGPAGSGPVCTTTSPAAAADVEELAHQARLADADVADDARARQRARLGAAGLEPREVVVAPDEAAAARGCSRRRLRRRGGRPRAVRRRRRTARRRAAAAALVSVRARSVAAPHSPQNFCDAGLSAPHDGQRGRARRRARAAGAVLDCGERAARAPRRTRRRPGSGRSASFASALRTTSTSGFGDLPLGRDLARVRRRLA